MLSVLHYLLDRQHRSQVFLLLYQKVQVLRHGCFEQYVLFDFTFLLKISFYLDTKYNVIIRTWSILMDLQKTLFPSDKNISKIYVSDISVVFMKYEIQYCKMVDVWKVYLICTRLFVRNFFLLEDKFLGGNSNSKSFRKFIKNCFCEWNKFISNILDAEYLSYFIKSEILHCDMLDVWKVYHTWIRLFFL